MRALVTSAPGGWTNTRLTEVELVAGRAEEVLVQIAAVGLNPADHFQIEGRYPGGPKPPFIPGRDACGVVIQGDATGSWQPGERVVVLQSASSSGFPPRISRVSQQVGPPSKRRRHRWSIKLPGRGCLMWEICSPVNRS